MSTSYKLDAVPAKMTAGNTIDLTPSSYHAPAGMNAQLDYSTKAPIKIKHIHHQMAARLGAHYYNKPVVMIASVYSLDARDFVVNAVYRVEA